MNTNDLAVLTGYPWQAADNSDSRVGLGLLLQTIELSRLVPTIRTPLHSFGLQTAFNHLRSNTMGVWTTKHLDQLGGASGGGCWRLGLSNDEKGFWRARRLRLIGIHHSSVVSGDETVVFETLVGRHLALIASDYDELREHMLRSWPAMTHWLK